MSKQVQGSFTMAGSVSSRVAFGLNPSVRDSAEKSSVGNFTVQEGGEVLHLEIELTESSPTATLDLETGMLGTEQLTDAYGDDIEFEAVLSFLLITDKPVTVGPAAANPWVEMLADDVEVKKSLMMIGDEDGWNVYANEGRISVSATLTGDDTRKVELIILGIRTGESSSP